MSIINVITYNRDVGDAALVKIILGKEDVFRITPALPDTIEVNDNE